MIKFLNYFLIATSLMWFACDGTNPEPVINGLFEGGAFVSNEGNFGDADGSLSFIPADGAPINNVFSSVNGAQLGDVVQSIHRSENLLFAVVNNSNKVVASSLDSMKLDYTITNVALPRYMTSANGKGYLTEWVSFTDEGGVTIFDLESGAIEKFIVTGFGAEGVLISGNKLFVSNNFSTTVSIIDVDSEVLIKTIEVGNAPALMIADAEGHLWVACAGGYDANYNPANDGKLVEFNSDGQILNTVELETNFNGKISSNASGSTLYYSKGTSVYTVATTGANQPELLLELAEATAIYGLGVDSEGNVYMADAVGFAENGHVYKYSTDTELITRYSVGRGPNGFAFN